ncbi:MAG: hypothetical protein WD734_01820, partial [Dehalococcoidia bacterium]
MFGDSEPFREQDEPPPQHDDFSKPEFGSAGRNVTRVELGASTGIAGGTTGWRHLNPARWFGKEVTYFTEYRTFNTFRREFAGAPEIREERLPTTGNPRREQREGDWCWAEEEVTYRRDRRVWWTVSQYYEIWRINETKQAYYSAVTGLAPLVLDGALVGSSASMAGASAATAAMELSRTAAFLSAAAKGAGALGFGLFVFQAGTWVMIEGLGGFDDATSEKLSDGWDFVEAEYGEWEDAGTITRWEMVGDRHRCADAPPERSRIGEVILVPFARTTAGALQDPKVRVGAAGGALLIAGLIAAVALMPGDGGVAGAGAGGGGG